MFTARKSTFAKHAHAYNIGGQVDVAVEFAYPTGL